MHLVWFQMLLMNPTQSNDHVAIDMHSVSHGVMETSWLQLWLSIAWIVWAWVCDSAQWVTHWCRMHGDAFQWLVPTRISLYLMPFLVTWRPREVWPGSSQQRSRPQWPASRDAPATPHAHSIVHSNPTRSVGSDSAIPQSRRNRWRH